MWTLLLNKKIWIAVAGAALITVVFFFGWWNASNRCEAKRLASVERAIEQAQEMQEEINLIESDYINRSEKVKKVYKWVDREVVKYVKDNSDVQCLTPDGVLLWNSANRPKDTTEPID